MEKNTSDRIIRVTAAADHVRAFALSGRETVRTAKEAHHTAPVATAALGRLLCGTALMGCALLKNEDELVTAQIEGDGPLGGLLATADCNGHVKGYVREAAVILPLREDGHLDVGRAVGRGTLRVSRDMGGAEPYSGQVELVSGEIAEDLNYYFAASEQIPSSVGLGVLVDRDGSVLEAGGFLIQLMPGAPEEVIDRLENNIKNMKPVTELLHDGGSPEKLLEQALNELDMRVLEEKEFSFYCNCSRERVEGALKLLGPGELDKMIADAKGEELRCRFCNKAYRFSVEELKAIREED
ncbi:MAG: Hsp33 family molecular chaperone HslO [Lachnospiraceae bacterium]|nr:Hsp33 family molecular chaperone HslO [Lachnospiraceae bacterium]